MPGIAIQATFDVKQGEPIDSRLVANDQPEREGISYKYPGLKVYQKDINRTFTFRGPLNSDWDVEGSGLYGGSGSLVGDTVVDFGTVSNSINDKSLDLVFQAATTGTTKAYLYNNFIRHTTSVSGSEHLGIEYRQQYKFFNGTSLVDGSYIAFNPSIPGAPPSSAITFNTGSGGNLSEKLRITNDGKIGIGTNQPFEFLQIGTSSTTRKPFVIRNESNTVTLGYNWYFNSPFDATFGSSKIEQSNGTVLIQNRAANSSTYNDTLFVGTASKVGIMTTTPTVELDVNGSINSNNNINGLTITGVTISASNRVRSKRYDLTNIPNTYLTTAPSISGPDDTLIISVRGTQSFRSNGVNNFLLVDTFVGGDLDVVGGDVDVLNGSITNYETSTTLIPDNMVFFSTNNGTFSSTTNLTNFTYSISAYRIGALVNLNYEIETTNNFGSGLSSFSGIMFKLTSDRFKPVSAAYSSGFGGNNAFGNFFPLITEVFQIDPTNGSATTLSNSDFWLRIRTTNLPGANQGYGFLAGSVVASTNKFKGTITFKAGDIQNVTPPSPPPIILVPLEIL